MSLYSKSKKRVFLSLYSKLKIGVFFLVIGVLVCNFLFFTQTWIESWPSKNTPVSTRFNPANDWRRVGLACVLGTAWPLPKSRKKEPSRYLRAGEGVRSSLRKKNPITAVTQQLRWLIVWQYMYWFLSCSTLKDKLKHCGSGGFTPTNIPVLCSLTEWMPSYLVSCQQTRNYGTLLHDWLYMFYYWSHVLNFVCVPVWNCTYISSDSFCHCRLYWCELYPVWIINCAGACAVSLVHDGRSSLYSDYFTSSSASAAGKC